MSNIRWDTDSWAKVTPRQFTKVIHDPARFFPTTLDLILTNYQEWQFFINRNYIATFNSWDEASLAAPMLYSLHKDNT